MTRDPVRIVGAGPCGIACARTLDALGARDWQIFEAGHDAGGLASSVVDPAGFTWDLGGHVVFSHFGEFDRLVAETLGEDVLKHERSSFIHSSDRWVPYPFQNNLHCLPDDRAIEAVSGIVRAHINRTAAATGAASGVAASGDRNVQTSRSFASWMLDVFGDGVVAQFMRPYNEKVWAVPLESMSADWIAERVSVVDWQTTIQRMISRTDDRNWGPNNEFSFPRFGGTGAIYRKAALPLNDRISYDAPVMAIDAAARKVQTGDGLWHAYSELIWTGPLDRLVQVLVDCPTHIREAATLLHHNSVTVVGMGYESPTRDDGSWFYFPDPEVPFYRATNFSKYSPENVPGGRSDLYSSYMTEIAWTPHRPLDRERLVERVDGSLRACGLVPQDAKVISAHMIDVPYAYPVPTLQRDEALAVIQPWLMERNIYSRGRFGAWRYEIGNMDHAVKMGIDVAKRVVSGENEELWQGTSAA